MMINSGRDNMIHMCPRGSSEGKKSLKERSRFGTLSEMRKGNEHVELCHQNKRNI
jgi:hypothetical protein